MTHKDIYTKFMIEYDKANVTSSYPSLTDYEVATVLDKAYNALIAQKVTGNNVRRATFEADVKAISDLQPLVRKQSKQSLKMEDTNVYVSNLPFDYLYFVTASLLERNSHKTATFEDSQLSVTTVDDTAIDSIANRKLPIKLVSHQMAENFIASSSNVPWVKTPVCFIENKQLYAVCDVWSNIVSTLAYAYEYRETLGGNTLKYRRQVDSIPSSNFSQGEVYTTDDITAAFNDSDVADYFNAMQLEDGDFIGIDVEIDDVDEVFSNTYYFMVHTVTRYPIEITYVKTPNKFAKDLDSSVFSNTTGFTYFDPGNGGADVVALYQFECNSTVAEELISLAIAFALENVESQRLNSKLNMRGLEA